MDFFLFLPQLCQQLMLILLLFDAPVVRACSTAGRKDPVVDAWNSEQSPGDVMAPKRGTSWNILYMFGRVHEVGSLNERKDVILSKGCDFVIDFIVPTLHPTPAHTYWCIDRYICLSPACSRLLGQFARRTSRSAHLGRNRSRGGRRQEKPLGRASGLDFGMLWIWMSLGGLSGFLSSLI